MNPMYRGAYGNCTAGFFRKKLSERVASGKLKEGLGEGPPSGGGGGPPDVAAILRTGVDHYGEQLRSISSLPDTSPEKLRASLLFHTFKGAKAELSSKPPKIVIQDLLSSLTNENVGDNFTLEIGKRLQAIADAIPDEAAAPPPDPAQDLGQAGGPADQVEPAPTPEGAAPDPSQPPAEEPAETQSDPEVSPDEFGDLVDKLEQ